MGEEVKALLRLHARADQFLDLAQEAPDRKVVVVHLKVVVIPHGPLQLFEFLPFQRHRAELLAGLVNPEGHLVWARHEPVAL